MNYGSVPPVAPPPGAKVAGKPPYGWIGAGAVVLTALSMMGSAGQSSSSVAASTKFPIQGRWVLVDTDEAAYCQSYQEFRADGSATDTKAGVTTAHQAKGIVYDVKPTYVLVSYGGYNFETWKPMGTDDLTLQLMSKYSVTACRYHRR